MKYLDIRQSLHYSTYTEHSKSLKLAADENLKLFLFSNDEPPSLTSDTKSVGLFNSTMLLYAVCIELMLKGRGLYEERDNILNGDIVDYSGFMKKWGGHKNGHDFFKIIEHYNIELTETENKIFKELISFTSWAGRFPFPIREHEIVNFENGNGKRGSLNMKYGDEIGKFISAQISIITD
jgi:hypothetical protein